MLERTGKAVTNFGQCLPAPQSDLAIESLKDPYRFDFLGLTEAAQERDGNWAKRSPQTVDLRGSFSGGAMRRYYLGSSTSSTKWITPLDWQTSALVTVAMPPVFGLLSHAVA